tara:strand:+ start:372 stop:677 length:306 start_codon:yes stop_codon:yes gene_type:complete
MFKKYFFKILTLIITLSILYGTNPDYGQHEFKVATMRQSKDTSDNILMCPLGYGKKSVSNFKQNSFIVYNVGILSYSIYEEELASFGILGKVFLRTSTNKV